MPYTVVYLDDAQDKLTEIWTHAADQGAVTAASNKIDALLKHGPLSVGHSIGTYRELIVPPLQVWYDTSPGDYLVTVLDIDLVN